jgi:hypothetical protein
MNDAQVDLKKGGSGPSAFERRRGLASARPGRTPELATEGLIPASPSSVFGFLADLENHWLVAGRNIEVLELTGPPGSRSGGSVRIRGPFGLSRTARTSVTEASAPDRMTGRAEIGRSTVATVSWTIAADNDGYSRVRLGAKIKQAGVLDRLILSLGGRRWMQRLFGGTLRTLANQFR